VKILEVRSHIDAAWPGIVRVQITGLVTDRALKDFWATLRSPLGAASMVSVFDFRQALVAFRHPPRLVPGAPQQKAGAFLCTPEQYEVLMQRALQLNALGVRRGVFCSEDLALQWAADEVRLARAKSRPYTRERSAPGARHR
jgi:hypothetical protein